MKQTSVRLFALVCLIVTATTSPPLLAQFTVSGRVSDPTGQGVYPVDIDAEDSQTGVPIPLFGDTTTVNGYYSISLFSGTYDLMYIPAPGMGLAPIVEKNVTVNSDITLDVTTPWGYEVSGIVTDSDGLPLVNLDIDVRDATTNEYLLTPSDNTDGNGYYMVTIPTGTFDFIYTPNWQDSLTTFTVWDVKVQSDTTMNITMPVSVDLTGFVRNSQGAGIPDVDLDVDEAISGRRIRTQFDNTNTDGSFLIHVPVGIWNVMFEAPIGSGYADHILYGLVVNHDLNLDITLRNGMEISGTVTDPLGRGIPNVDLDVNDVLTGERLHTSHDNTDSTGYYSIMVPPGLYNIFFEETTDNLSVAPAEIDSQLITGNTVINLTLPRGYFVTGTIQDDNGSRVENCDLDFVDVNTGEIIYTPGDNSDKKGNYSVRITAGTYHIIFQPVPESGVKGDTIPSVTINSDLVQNVTLQRIFNQAVVLEPTRASIFAGDILFESITIYNNDTSSRRIQVSVNAHLPGGGVFPILPPYPVNGRVVSSGDQIQGTLPISVPNQAPLGIDMTVKGVLLDFNQGDTLGIDQTEVKILDPNNLERSF